MSVWCEQAVDRSELVFQRARLLWRSPRESEAESQGTVWLSRQLGSREGLAYIVNRAAKSMSR